MQRRLDRHTAMFLVAIAALAGGCGSSDSGDSAQTLSDYQAWIEGLPGQYAVAQGNAYLMQNTDCPTYVDIFDSCFGQNPASPYIIPQPAVGDSYVDPIYAAPLDTPGPDGTTNIIYRLSDNDALVTIISYPPQAAYLGYQSYVFTRETSYYADITPPRTRVVSPDPDRYEIFGSLGNDVNSIIVQDQYGQGPWGGHVIVYITTSNQALADALIASARARGLTPDSIFVEPVGANVITGTGAEADDMITLMRYAVPESLSAATDWQNALSSNALVYTVSNASLAVSRFGATPYTAHTVNTSETGLATALQQLAALLATYLESTAPTLTAASVQSQATTQDDSDGVPVSGLVGSSCIAYGVSCEGDNQDTSTYATLIDYVLLLGPDDTAFVAGVNHAAERVDNSHYVSVDVYNAATSAGVAASSQTNRAAAGFDSGVLAGSAERLLADLGIAIPPGNQDLLTHLSKLYATFVTRDCSSPAIAAASALCVDLMGNTLIPLNEPVSIVERSYVVPGSTTGGYAPDMVYPYIIAGANNFVAVTP